MASQANVYTSASNAVMYTDKVRISTDGNSVTYNVKIQDLADGTFPDTIFSAAVQIPPYSTQDVFVGVGNRLTVTGGNITIAELGTASSATAGVY